MRNQFNKILITGGAGFIGSALVRHLIYKTNIKVLNVDALTYAGNLESLEDCQDDQRYHFVHADITDANIIQRVLQEFQPDAILHLAADSHVDRSIDNPAEFVQNNIVGTYTLLEATRTYWASLAAQARDRFRFLHVSTDEVYGSLGQEGLFTEHSPYQPTSPYAASKASSDHLVRAWHCTYGLPILMTHCSNNYGPYQFPEKLIPLMILNAMEGRPLPVYGNGEHIRDWLYVEDHVRALLQVLTQGKIGEGYNISSHNEKTNLEVVKQICVLLDEMLPDSNYKPHAQLLTLVEDRPGHDRRYALDATKLATQLGWYPTETFNSGLRKTVQWYLNNDAWCQRAQDGSYRRGRLGLGQTISELARS